MLVTADAPVVPRHAVFMRRSLSESVVLVGERCVEISSDGTFDPSEAWRLLGRGHTPRACSEMLGCPGAAIVEFVSALGSAGLLADPSNAGSTDPDEAVRVLRASATMWKRHAILHPLFRLLDDEEPRRDLLAALLVEMCHYTRRAPVIGELAAESATTDEARTALSGFAEEEANHYKSLAEGAARLLEVGASDVLESHPAPATIGLLSTMQVLAQGDAACYGAFMCFTEVEPAVAGATASDFAALARKNAAPDAAVEPVAEHVLEDASLSHVDLGAEIMRHELRAQRTVPRERLEALATAVHDLKHAFDLVNDELVRTTDSRPYELRRGIDWERL